MIGYYIWTVQSSVSQILENFIIITVVHKTFKLTVPKVVLVNNLSHLEVIYGWLFGHFTVALAASSIFPGCYTNDGRSVALEVNSMTIR